MTVKLGVNIDHVATLRNVRGTPYPCPVQAALLAEAAGADGITAHLREDRRHIRDQDIRRLKREIGTRLNLEMANTEEMVAIALDVKPYMVTLVPERREELTTEGGLDVVQYLHPLKTTTQRLQDEGILVSLFIEPDLAQLDASYATGAKIVEFHTGKYCELFDQGRGFHQRELERLLKAADVSVQMGVEVNAGHGLTVTNVGPVLAMAGLNELNIGHSIVADAVMMGFGPAVARIKAAILQTAPTSMVQ